MRSARVFSFKYQLNNIIAASAALLLGLGMFFFPYRVFGGLVAILPYGLIFAALIGIVSGARLKRNRSKRYIPVMAAALAVGILGIVLLSQKHWCDSVLWYIFMLYLVFSAYRLLQPAWQRGLETQKIWRYLSALTVWGFALLMLFKPQSGLSDALTILSIFLIAWALFQLLLPPPQE